MRVFICLFAVLLIAMLSVLNITYYHRSEQTARQFAEQSLEETARLLQDRMDSVAASLQSIAFEGGGSEFCVNGHSWRNENQHYIRTQLNQLVLDGSIVNTAILYTHDGAYCAVGNQTQNPYLLYKRLEKEMGIANAFRKALYSAPEEVGDKVFIHVVVPVWDQTGSHAAQGSYCGVMVAQINIMNLLEQVNVTARPLKIVFSDDPEQQMTADEQPDARMLSYALKDYGWTLYHTDIRHDQSDSIRQMLKFTLITGMLMLVLHIAFIWLFQRMVVLPIERLADTVRNSTSDSLTVLDDISSRNELVLLTGSINKMLQRIRRSNEEQAQRLRERAMFMQARINPHFLYNNLECIRGMAVMQQYGAIRELTGVMADIYRYCNHSEPYVALHEELECAKKYIRLLSLRYPDRLTLEIDAAEETMDMRVPRMCLQPLLENSVYHGILEVGRTNGILLLRAWAENDLLHLTLADNGCGMTAEQYDRVNATELADDYAVKHIGISNVRSRTKLLCGEDSSLMLSPGDNGGVVAEFILSSNM